MNMKKQQVMVKSRRISASSTTSSVVTTVIYGECQKNHAASIGGYAVDGCLEFMASDDDDGTGNAALMCAACGCHRNFHRKEVQSEVVCEYSPPESGRFR